MIELTADNVLAFLRDRGWIEPGPACVEPLSGGVSNQVLRIITARARYVLKQSRPQLRTRDLWLSDLNRIEREHEVMQALQPLLPPLTVPEVLFVDRANYVYVMSHAPAGARVWKDALLAGDTDAAVAKRVGRVLGKMHQNTATRPDLMALFRDHTVFVQLRVDPFYRRIQERRSEVARVVGDLVDQMLAFKQALCHGDYTPKNMLLHDHGFMLVDYETAHHGDPTMDLGLFLCHLLLKAFRSPTRGEDLLRLTSAFWQGYTSETQFCPAPELERRGLAHCGVCLLARIDGTSPVDYLPEEPRREAVRRLARRVLLAPLCRWRDVEAICRNEWARLNIS